jgi:hypothetical protein
MRDDAERQRRFLETAAQTAGNASGQRDWASSLGDDDLAYYVERARSWVNASGADAAAVSGLASACENIFSERNPDSM